MNSFGRQIRLTTFGESHGVAIGGVLDGIPAGFVIDFSAIDLQLQRRKTGQDFFASQRQEPEQIEWLSGIFEGKTLGTPIAFIIKNNDAKSQDYESLKNLYRPSHADFTYDQKYGFRDHRGGGRASARETAVRVVAGSIARQILSLYFQIEIVAYVSQIGALGLEKKPEYLDFLTVDQFITRCPDSQKDQEIQTYLAELKIKKDSIGGVIYTEVNNVPVGLGEPIYDKLQARLAYAMLSINAVKGFSYGAGFESVALTGSQQNDVFTIKDEKIITKTNFSGGIQGGISNGAVIEYQTLFKPISSIGQVQKLITKNGQTVNQAVQGRHDVCVVPRAVPIVEAMSALVFLDFLFNHVKNINKIKEGLKNI